MIDYIQGFPKIDKMKQILFLPYIILKMKNRTYYKNVDFIIITQLIICKQKQKLGLILKMGVVLFRYINQGRDTYISFNNGGFLKQYLSQGGYESGSYGKDYEYKKYTTPIKAKMIHYGQNGTGRDMYIHYNNGGLSDNEIRGKFIKTLRDTYPIRKRNRILSMQIDTSPMKSTRLNSSQLIQRLSRPKVSQDPYEFIRKF
ncbi:hypothetical protein pb186bvf_003011 [Paramecium bursaria]